MKSERKKNREYFRKEPGRLRGENRRHWGKSRGRGSRVKGNGRRGSRG